MRCLAFHRQQMEIVAWFRFHSTQQVVVIVVREPTIPVRMPDFLKTAALIKTSLWIFVIPWQCPNKPESGGCFWGAELRRPGKLSV
jgi:hypothetical protein